MRILILADNISDFDIMGHPEHIAPLEGPGPRRDLALLLPRLDPARVQLKYLALHGENSLNARGRFDLRAAWRLAKIMRDDEIELVHALTPESVILAAIAGRVVGIPVLASVYSADDPTRYNLFADLRDRFVHAVMRWGIDRIIVPADLIRQNMWRVRYPAARIHVIYPGVEMRDPDAPAPDREALGLPAGPMATMIAPLVEDQGINVLLDTVPRLMLRVPDPVIVVVGSGPLLLKTQQKTHKLPIRWLGERADVRDIIATSDVIVVHPRLDSLPRAVFEAAAAGKPVIASRVAGISEIVEHGVTGTLVTYEDARDLAIQISRYLMQPTYQHEVGKAARQRAQTRFSLEVERETMTTFYEATVYASR